MKKFTIIERNETTKDLTEKAYFAESSKDVKDIPGFVAITKTERVKHPSPEVMQRVLLQYQLDKTTVDLAEFYTRCENVAAALEEQTEKPTDKAEKPTDINSSEPAKQLQKPTDRDSKTA